MSHLTHLAPAADPAPDPAPASRSDDPKTAKILAAAKETFMELGYANASMDQVAQRARASKTTVYTRFPSKEILFAATISAECERRGMRFTADEFDDLPLDEALRRIGRRFVDLIWSEEAIRLRQIITGEAPRFPDVARLFHEAGPQRARAAVRAYLARAAERGLAPRVTDPDLATRAFLSALDGGSYCPVMLGLCPPPPEENRDAFVARVVDLFVNGAR